jgi:hypothetical protein
MLVLLAPSTRVLLMLRLVPLTLNTSAREGFDGIEWALPGGENPATVRNSCW